MISGYESKKKRSTHKALYNFHSISSTSLFHARKFIVWSKYSITCKGFLGTFPGVSSLLVCFNVVAKPYHPVLQDDLNASIWLVCALKIESCSIIFLFFSIFVLRSSIILFRLLHLSCGWLAMASISSISIISFSLHPLKISTVKWNLLN